MFSLGRHKDDSCPCARLWFLRLASNATSPWVWGIPIRSDVAQYLGFSSNFKASEPKTNPPDFLGESRLCILLPFATLPFDLQNYSSFCTYLPARPIRGGSYDVSRHPKWSHGAPFGSICRHCTLLIVEVRKFSKTGCTRSDLLECSARHLATKGFPSQNYSNQTVSTTTDYCYLLLHWLSLDYCHNLFR